MPISDATFSSNDTARIGTVDSMIGTTQNAAFVLAMFGAHHSARALDLLTAHLDDPRAGVRRWALQAFQFAVPRPVALARLRAAVGGLTHPDAQRAVRQAIERLSERGGGGGM